MCSPFFDRGTQRGTHPKPLKATRRKACSESVPLVPLFPRKKVKDDMNRENLYHHFKNVAATLLHHEAKCDVRNEGRFLGVAVSRPVSCHPEKLTAQ